MRLRDELRPLEPRLRTWLRRDLHRGRIDITIDALPLDGARSTVRFDRELAKRLIRDLRELAESCGEPTDSVVSLADLLRLPEVVAIESDQPDWSQSEMMALEKAVKEALGAVVALREAEGASLHSALQSVREGLEGVREGLEERRQIVVSLLSASLAERLRQLLDAGAPGAAELDRSRLEQEVAILVEKSDVTEELDRLDSHCRQLDEALGQEGPVGRRLDFLSQEILRELNTVGSKCRDAAMAHAVIEGKLLCEQLREQSQNVE